ncbi:type I restriction-modification system endonuclease [Chryseobacterium koreense]|uniref:Restriction endonuclease subunit R n=1 Tax=Chryseobacterium koreense CCUG 49689 TaxID=1304281 RepID=A0A0J7LP19_9FLAO|nr:type I restriction-modification system endonuclease [Chryseobacterium koreense]KMQ70825.1 restriction endonuclease subunit R [Chryseobacterium koreense CCUG 49689]MBB5332537.1 type I restriction enzyme R subunit [Chryseobacterium koreense]
MESKFTFLLPTYEELFQFATVAEKLYFVDPSSSIAKSRLVAEKLIRFIAAFEELEVVDMKQVDIINFLKYYNILPDQVKNLFHFIRKSGNTASHEGIGTKEEALSTLESIYKLLVWFFETYENDFIADKTYIPLQPTENKEEIEELNKKLEGLTITIQQYEEKIRNFNISEEQKASRRKLAEQKADKIQWSEKETRIQLIDPQLRDAGWECDTETVNYKTHKTLPEKNRNMAIAEWPCKGGYVDYALFVGTKLYAVVEAKRFGTDISTDLYQSKVYAENIVIKEEVNNLGIWEDYKVPFAFSTNGRAYFEQLRTKSGIWFQDIRISTNRSRPLRGWYSPKGLEELFERDIHLANQKLQDSNPDYLTSKNGLNLYYYQLDAINAVEDKIINQPEEQKALIVMATGTGKTRTINGLIYRLIKANRFERILFLTDRRLLSKQAIDSIKENKIELMESFSGIYKLEELKIARPDSETRLHFATVQSMVKRLFYSDEPPLTVDAYDCIIVDEAHRGYNLDKELDDDELLFKNEEDYFSQYKRVLEYFDAYRIGLTATPALHTTQVFGMPTYSYSYRQAVIDGYLVDFEPPFEIVTELNSEGIKWQKGEKPTVYDLATGEIVDLAELEDDLKFEIDDFNKRVLNENFNREVVKKLVEYLDPEGEEKTLIFAARDSHADTVVDLLKEEFENIGVDLHDKAIVKITGSVYNNEQLTRDFKYEKYPNIVVTVDLLSTGVDVRPICNIVFLRRVKSRILYEQMLGRATRLCPEIGKESFRIFDAVKQYEAMEEFTTMKPVSNPSFTFKQLTDELDKIRNDDILRKQADVISAKLNRKLKKMSEEQKETFAFYSREVSVEDFMKTLKEKKGQDLYGFIKEHVDLWDFLDQKVYKPIPQFISDHPDQVREVRRGYGNASKPEDYIEGFKTFIEDNKNTIDAIRIICNRPQDLDRKSLKELKLLLDEKGYTESHLNTAWKSTKNVDIAADIIAYIRTLSLGTDLISHEQRIKNAIAKIKQKKSFNAIQTKWIDRFEKQLLAESVLTKKDLDLKPFIDEGGFKRLDKIFNYELEPLIAELNTELYA